TPVATALEGVQDQAQMAIESAFLPLTLSPHLALYLLYRFIAASTPSPSTSSTALAARSTAFWRVFVSCGVGSLSTHTATTSGSQTGSPSTCGRPMPTRTRGKSVLASAPATDLIPLWPPVPPFALIRSRPAGRSSSS